MAEASSRFLRRFTELSADRLALLVRELNGNGLSPSLVDLGGSRHVLIGPDLVSAPGAVRTVLAAHYDRAPGSPGANDNSAAVVQLIETAKALRASGAKDWLVVFTDREEISPGCGVRSQGSYQLAEGFKSIGLADSEFFIFDACGRGDTLIVSTTMDSLIAAEGSASGGVTENADRARRAARGLRSRALEAGRFSFGGRMLLAPTPFSDDAGFLAAGLAAQTITVLPAAEAAALTRALRARPKRSGALINEDAREALGKDAYEAIMPATWKALHGKNDDLGSLSEAAFPLVEKFALRLVRG